jgi:ABC-type transport system involved in multi-copper enzyme maturation permease subunit
MESLRVLRVEIFRMLRSRAVLLSAALLVFVPALWVWFTHALKVVGREVGGGAVDNRTGVGWGVFVDGWRVGLVLGTVLLVIHASRSLAADRESWVLRLAVTRRTSRAALVLGRALLAPLLVLLVLVLSGLGSWCTAGLCFDFGPVGEDGYVIFSAAEVRSELGTAVLAAVGPMIATYLLGLLVSALSATAVLGVSLGLGLFLCFDLFKDVLSSLRFWIFANFVPSFRDTSAMAEISSLAKGYSDAGFTEEVLRLNQILPWPQAALILAATLAVMSRRAL